MAGCQFAVCSDLTEICLSAKIKTQTAPNQSQPSKFVFNLDCKGRNMAAHVAQLKFIRDRTAKGRRDSSRCCGLVFV